MKLATHLKTSGRLVGVPLEVDTGYARAKLATLSEMVVDEYELVHGGFAFGLADYAAMLAVNDPNVVLGAAECRFLAPVKCGEEMLATAKVVETDGKRRRVKCDVSTDKLVFQATFDCFVLNRHVLDGK